ncbi:MAG: RluA family pseudouridine synthase [Lachnospiraceae bacterium]|nr:RluA family pseudouridine synthase [Lachnospiraceae bacterium]
MRIFEYQTTSEDVNLPIKSFLKKQGFSRQSQIVLKRLPDSVLVNDTPVFLTYRLQADDHLTIRLTEESSSAHILPVHLPVDIVYEDADLLIVNKAAGMPIHPSQNNRDNTLGNALAWYFAQKEEPFVFRCINRLDRDTSGLTIIAKHIVSAGILSAMVSSKDSLVREYLAIAKGSVSPASGTITAPLARKEGSIIERVVDFEKGEHAVTHYRVLSEKNGYSLLSLILETGRTHQIRVHMKYLGYPLIGDYLYNPDMERMTRQALHAYRLRFTHPITRQPLEFTAPLPPDMQWML